MSGAPLGQGYGRAQLEPVDGGLECSDLSPLTRVEVRPRTTVRCGVSSRGFRAGGGERERWSEISV